MQRTRTVAKYKLFGKPCYESFYSVREFFHRHGAVCELTVNVAVFDDRSRYKLWKKRNVGSEIDIIALKLGLAEVKIDGVGYDLEGIEGYPDGERKPRNGRKRGKERGYASQIFNEKVGIFEKYKEREVDEYGRP